MSKRLRFEVLKRDGFRCRYCGANAASSLLHVDHVIPVSGGGSSDPENLVTACSECNLGKSNIGLDESKVQPGSPTDDMLAHAEQMRAYLAAVKVLDDARNELIQFVIDRWVEVVDPEGMQRQLISSLQYWIEQVGLERVLAAVDATGRAGHLRYPNQQRKYFLACVRNARDEGKAL